MKKNIIALAIASAIAAPSAMAGAPTVYGKMHLAVEKVEGGDASVNEHDSRLGVKGSEDLGNGLKAIYKVEFALKTVADGGDETLSQRNTYLGLKGGFGQVMFGTHDTPTKMIQPSDLFGDTYADVKYFDNGLDDGENRFSDTAMYVSPSFSGVKLIAAAVLNEEGATDADKSDWTNVAVTYGSVKKGLYLAAAYQDAGDIDETVVRVSAQYKMSDLIASIMYQDNSGDDQDNGNFTQLQFGYKFGKIMPKVKYVMANNDTDDSNESGYAVGLDYKLGKKTTAYVYTSDASDVGGDKVNFSFGLVHKF
ncbi:porin [Thiomicrorhabdus sp. 6S2-11]|jgi:predicted porin|uniref:Porin n=1 Tax=Thiomicrorhabdus marina TaxID=2818442 RepID=A0ABS3Q3C6_9GAMM|nr:porin [Thiomicrorhabdus marina]MBO1926833.1 porin [Thiomicrorhabdus marina]